MTLGTSQHSRTRLGRLGRRTPLTPVRGVEVKAGVAVQELSLISKVKMVE